MKFATAKEHRDFFQKQGWIEFEEMISKEQLILANEATDSVLAERLKMSPIQLQSASAENMYAQGRDLWRSHAFLRKLATQLRFAEIAAELTEKKPLRLGYDQLYLMPHQITFSQKDSNSDPYFHFLEKTASLESVSCLSNVVCGLLLAFNGKEDVSSELKSEGLDIFPNKAGNAVFFQPHLPIPWNLLSEHAKQRFYMIVYTSLSSHYQLQPFDPHTHDLKHLGYVFNDKLHDKLHPIIYR